MFPVLTIGHNFQHGSCSHVFLNPSILLVVMIRHFLEACIHDKFSQKICSPVSFVMKCCPISTTCVDPASIQNFACVLRAPHRLITVRLLRRTPGRTPFHPCAVLPRPVSRTHPVPATLFSVSTITDGNAQAGAAAHFPPLRWPDCTLSRLRAEEYDRPVTQSIATPAGAVFEDDPHPGSDADRPPGP